ncbi:MAG: extracellular solute-binding protein [Clostridiales bacterium]|nr:extracellular solute-binding protein [Clostridiales bacterium]
MMKKITRRDFLRGSAAGIAGAFFGTAMPLSALASEDSGYQTTYGDKIFDDVTITVEIFDRSNAPEGSTVVDNKWVDYVNQEMNKVGITVDFVAVPRSEESTKIQVMMASGTAPDLILTYDQNLATSYYEKGGLTILNDYVDGEDQARNIKEYVTEETMDACRADNDELWGIAAKRDNTIQSNLFIRKDWLDILGMDVPETVDELYEVLKAFKEENPGNVDNLIPFLSTYMGYCSYSVMAGAFMTSVSDETEFNIRSYRPVYADDGYTEYLRFLNKLYNEGLTDPEYYTYISDSTQIAAVVASGRVGFYEGGFNDNLAANKGSVLQTLRAANPDAEFVSIPPLQSVNDGEQYNWSYESNGAYLLIPKTCKNVEAVLTYLDWQGTRDGGYVLANGFEGEHYELEDGIPVVIDTEYNAEDLDWIRYDIFLLGNGTYFESEELNMQTYAKKFVGYEDYVIDNFENGSAGTCMVVPAYVSETQGTNSTEITLVMDENHVKCITCGTDEFDTAIDTYRTAMGKAGMEQVIEERTEYFS